MLDRSCSIIAIPQQVDPANPTTVPMSDAFRRHAGHGARFVTGSWVYDVTLGTATTVTITVQSRCGGLRSMAKKAITTTSSGALRQRKSDDTDGLNDPLVFTIVKPESVKIESDGTCTVDLYFCGASTNNASPMCGEKV